MALLIYFERAKCGSEFADSDINSQFFIPLFSLWRLQTRTVEWCYVKFSMDSYVWIITYILKTLLLLFWYCRHYFKKNSYTSHQKRRYYLIRFIWTFSYVKNDHYVINMTNRLLLSFRLFLWIALKLDVCYFFYKNLE